MRGGTIIRKVGLFLRWKAGRANFMLLRLPSQLYSLEDRSTLYRTMSLAHTYMRGKNKTRGFALEYNIYSFQRRTRRGQTLFLLNLFVSFF